MEHQDYMRRALQLAAQAQALGDVPVGCVLVQEGVIVGEGRNRREERGDATAHAELEAIRDACHRLGGWRLQRCTMYVTLEPCPMCSGAILQARIPEVHYGAKDPYAGACGSIFNLFEEPLHHHPKLYLGPLEQECQTLLKDFFQSLRTGPAENI